MIEIRNLTRTVSGRAIVEDVSFAARDGRITGLLGPNGAGKTTTLRMITGLVRPNGGTVRIDGHEARSPDLNTRSLLGVLTEDPGLYPRLSVREHLAYSAGLQGIGSHGLEQAVARAAELMGITDLLGRRTAGFSRGERQRLALARVLMHDPPNLLLDEPTSGLDVAANRSLRDLIRQLAEQGRCVIVSSHVMQDVAALCHVVVIMKRGRVIAQGSPADLLERTGCSTFEDAFLAILGDGEGLS